MKVVGMMRVRDEARWIDRCVRSILPLCDEIIILDDHSADHTVSICKSIPRVSVYDSPYEGLNEARDKNMLLDIVLQSKPEWIVAIDGDEMLAPEAVGLLRDALDSQWPCLSLRIKYLWDLEDQVRVDGVYGDFHRESVFRPVAGVKFTGNGNGANFHCGNVPAQLRQKRAVLNDVSLLHFGYLYKQDRERKYRWYTEHDPDNRPEDNYRHMVIGDIFSPNSRFVHGGPLRLEPLQ